MNTASAEQRPAWRQRLFEYHHRAISMPRAERIAEVASRLLSPWLPTRPSLLDVGCGDGHIARRVAAKLGASTVEGVDILIQPALHIIVRRYDGCTLPYPDDTFDALLLSDVLHHARRPQALLDECLRVSRCAVFVKDHFAHNLPAHGMLWLMDLAGNASSRVAVSGRYFNHIQWRDMLVRAQATQHQLCWPLRIHSLPWRLLARSSLQFAAVITPNAAAARSTHTAQQANTARSGANTSVDDRDV